MKKLWDFIKRNWLVVLSISVPIIIAIGSILGALYSLFSQDSSEIIRRISMVGAFFLSIALISKLIKFFNDKTDFSVSKSYFFVIGIWLVVLLVYAVVIELLIKVLCSL